MTGVGDAGATPAAAAGRVIMIAGALVALMQAGGNLAVPSRPSTWPDWAAQQDPVTLLFAGLRMVALATGVYLLAITALGVVLMVMRPTALRPILRRVTVPAVRGLVQSVLGLSVAAVTALPSAAMTQHGPSISVDKVVQLGPADSDQPPPPGAPASAQPAAHVEHRRPSPGDPSPQRWQVRPGDHFWAIAQAQLQARHRRMPNDEATARYWRRLVEHNRHRLSDPANPDLLLAGQVIELPPVETED